MDDECKKKHANLQAQDTLHVIRDAALEPAVEQPVAADAIDVGVVWWRRRVDKR